MQQAVNIIKQYAVTSLFADEDVVTRRVDSLETKLNKLIPRILNENQKAALISLVSDIGYDEFLKSDMLHYIESGNFQVAANNFLKYVTNGRTVSASKVARRNSEKQLFLTEV